MSDAVSRVLAAGGREGVELQAAENEEGNAVGPRVQEPERGQLVVLLESLEDVVFKVRAHRTTLVNDRSGEAGPPHDGVKTANLGAQAGMAPRAHNQGYDGLAVLVQYL